MIIKLIVILALLAVVALLATRGLRGKPSPDREDVANPRIPSGEQADTPSPRPGDEPRA